VAATTQNAVRSVDMLSRWGGEEFTALIANVDSAGLRAIAEKLRALVSQSKIARDGVNIEVTVSVGATLANEGDTPETLVKRADGLMYKGKEGGRNRVVFG
jgi:diguanylate cyclase (GGDEF)-like protein